MPKFISKDEVSVTRCVSNSYVTVSFHQDRLSAKNFVVEVTDQKVTIRSCFTIIPKNAKIRGHAKITNTPAIRYIEGDIPLGRYAIDPDESDDDTITFYLEDKID